MKKRIPAAILCIFVVVTVLGVPVAQARWTNTSTIHLDMSYSSGTITSEGTVVGKAGTSGIRVTYTLEKLAGGRYTYIDSWDASSGSIYLGSTHYTDGCTRGTYRLTVSGTVTKDGYAEPIEDWLTKTL